MGSLDYVASSSKSSWEAAKIREAASNSGYSKELVRAALSVNRKVSVLTSIRHTSRLLFHSNIRLGHETHAQSNMVIRPT